MVARASSCQPKQLERLVLDQLDEPQMDYLAEHLEDCATCRYQLEQLTGGSDWLRETRVFLSDTSLETRELESVAKHELHFLTPSDEPSSLGKLGNYEVLGVLGRGGMGIVLKAIERSLDRVVAIKVLASPFSSQGIARQRFAREAQAAAAVVHPNVMAIHRVEPDHDPPYFVMPLVAGESLQHKLDQEGSLELEELLRVAYQVAEGLAAAHGQGLIHRDVKPANILLEPGTDRALLTDFGLARAVDDVSLTCTGLIAGTPQYMSPEQARGEGLSHQADLFSLGSVIYAMATGRPPFRAESTYGLLKKIAESPHRSMRESNPRVPVWLDILVDRLLTKHPKERYASASALAKDLKESLAHVQQPMHFPVPEHLRKRKAHSSKRIAFATSIAVVVCLAVGLGIQVHRLTTSLGSSSTSLERDDASLASSQTKAFAELATDSNGTPGVSPSDLYWQTSAESELLQLHFQLLSLERESSSGWPGTSTTFESISREGLPANDTSTSPSVLPD